MKINNPVNPAGSDNQIQFNDNGIFGGATVIYDGIVLNLMGITIAGNNFSGGNLTLQSSSHATKGNILFGSSAYDEVNNRLGIGSTSPVVKLVIVDADSPSFGTLMLTGVSYNTDFVGIRAVTNADNDIDFQIGRKLSSDGVFYAGMVFKGSSTALGLGLNVTSPGAQTHVKSFNSSTITMILQGAASQSANIFEMQNSSGIVGFLVNASGGFVANEASLDIDCRIEGNNDANLFYTDAGTDRVGIGESAPDYKLDVNGTFGFTPGTSVTPADNGDVVIEATNNTTLTLKLKGSDGTVRTVALTLA